MLMRLIEAGQLARAALLAPLIERGLEPGEEAMLAVLSAEPGLDRDGLCEALGVSMDDAGERIARLIARDLLAEAPDGLHLTERGQRLQAALASAWDDMETELLAGLEPKRLKSLDKSLRALLSGLHGNRAP